VKGRSTTDILILMVAGTVCFSVLAAGATVGITAIVNPDSDLSPASNAIGDVINTLIGLLAGFLAGRTDATQRRLEREELAERMRELRENDAVGDE